MVTIIKNQLLKHLSRFTKNLSPEQISLSALRGSGELQDLTLDEDLMTDLLELPGWLRLTSAKCNRASFRIQWTKLKTVPIILEQVSWWYQSRRVIALYYLVVTMVLTCFILPSFLRAAWQEGYWPILQTKPRLILAKLRDYVQETSCIRSLSTFLSKPKADNYKSDS